MLICYYYIFRPSFCYRLPEFSGSTQGSMEPTAVPWPKARSTCCTVTGTSWQKGCGMCWPGTTPPRNCTHFKATGVRRHKTKMKGTACCLGCLPEDGFCGMWDFTIHKLFRAILEVSENHKTATLHAGVNNYSTGNAVCWTPLNTVNNSMPYSHISKIKLTTGYWCCWNPLFLSKMNYPETNRQSTFGLFPHK